jgi:nucleotide-binding universal stress UspA family protein
MRLGPDPDTPAPRTPEAGLPPPAAPTAAAQAVGTRAGGRIVVGIDGSDQSRAAVRWAVEQARAVGGAVEAVAVWQEPLMFAAEQSLPVPDLEGEAQRWLADAVPTVPDGLQVHARVESGDPSSVLLDLAADAALLVLGNRGRGGFTGAVMGSVAQRCAHHARCPVVLVPATERHEP